MNHVAPSGPSVICVGALFVVGVANSENVGPEEARGTTVPPPITLVVFVTIRGWVWASATAETLSSAAPTQVIFDDE